MRIGFIIVALALGACTQQPATYAPDVERNFMSACENQGSANALCACVWDKIEANITPGDFASLEIMPGPQREAHPLTAQISGYVADCNADLMPHIEPGEDDPVPGP
ncbi:MAG: hypothetical protein JNL81_13895 [Hyphomonadaceae bacterium]|nr:hypothetical protein [Hyphomonadaceae bacterium]